MVGVTFRASPNRVRTFLVTEWHCCWKPLISDQWFMRMGGRFCLYSGSVNLPMLKVSLKSPLAWLTTSSLQIRPNSLCAGLLFGVFASVAYVCAIDIPRKSRLYFKWSFRKEFFRLLSKPQSITRHTISKARSTAELGIPWFFKYINPQVYN